ncbi:RNA polymerase sigma factor [Chitinophaga lutea]
MGTADETLWNAFRDGDEAAFTMIYDRYFDRLYEYGMRLHAEESLVKDAIQEQFIKLWTNRRTLSANVSVRPYLLVSLRGNIYNRLRTGATKLVAFDQEAHDFRAQFSAESAYIRREEQNEDQRRLLDALNRLNPRQKEMIYLRYFEELDYDAIADIMGISVKGVYKLNARALEKLRDILQLSIPAILTLLAGLRIDV